MRKIFKETGWSKISLGNRVAVLLLLGILSYICIQLAGGANMTERRVFIRYWNCLVCLFISIAVPHLLFPDADLYLVQTINLNQKQLLKHQFRKLGIALVAIGFPAIILVFYDLDNMTRNILDGMILLAESWLFLFGIGCHAFQKYTSIGQRSQEWREGKRGKLYRRLRMQIPAERVPTMLATVNITFWGMHLIVLGAYLSYVYRSDFEWLLGLLLLSWAAVRMLFKIKTSFTFQLFLLIKLFFPFTKFTLERSEGFKGRLKEKFGYDRHFYCTNAFYEEAFKDLNVPDSKESESVTYPSLYWVPRRWRPHVWTGLIQLNRRLPLAVFMVLGHIFLWLLFYFQTSDALITAYLLLFLVVKNGASYLLVTKSAAPIHFQATLQSSLNWVVTRFFINLRWTFLFVLNLPLIAWIWDSFTFSQARNWVGLDILLAFLSALLFTYFHETQSKLFFKKEKFDQKK